MLAGFIVRAMTSRLGLAAMLLAGAYGWHVYDNRLAINAARDGFVREFELIAAQTELDVLRRRAIAVSAANEVLAERAATTEGEAIRMARELEEFQNATPVSMDCAVDRNIFDRLSNR